MNEEEKISTRLYLRITLLFFCFFIVCLAIFTVIFGILLLTPLAPMLIRGMISSTIVTLICIYLSSAILSCFITYFVCKKIAYPLVDLSNKSLKVAQGDFNVFVPEKSSLPELKTAIHSFNMMVKELSKVETLSNDFISNVSHEFKAPLSVIRSYVNILENTDLDEEERRQCLQCINESTEKLSMLISNVLKICKLDNQNVTIEKKSYRLDEQLRKNILLFDEQFDKKNIELDIALENCILCSDEGLLDLVWKNLLSNAIKFTDAGGKISVSLIKTEKILVTIRDNGIGMDEETKKHIFDRFYQGDTSHARDGNGLGLTIVGKILKLCKATIHVESQPGEGSAFTVIFPLTDQTS